MKTFRLGGIAIAATLSIQSVPAASQARLAILVLIFFFGGSVGALVLGRPRALRSATRVYDRNAPPSVGDFQVVPVIRAARRRPQGMDVEVKPIAAFGRRF